MNISSSVSPTVKKLDFSQWEALESRIASARVRKCNQTMHKLLGGDNPSAGGPESQKLPRVGMAFSGGGWRAMMSAVALMDALSIPLDKAETVSGEDGIKLFDTISHIFGLSGGSWAAFVSLAGGDRNPFHHDPLDKTPVGPEDRKRHPWLHGQQNKFDSDVHTYTGLKYMTDSTHVSQSCYRGGAVTRVVSLSSSLADTTFGSALAASLLGSTLVERWSNFLANDILSFKDYGELKAPSKEAEKLSKQTEDTVTPTEEELAAATAGSATAINAVQSAVSAAAVVASKDPNIGSNARSVKLSELRRLIDSGDFPFVANTAIADIPVAVAASGDGATDKSAIAPSKTKFNNNTRLYNWIEISPYFIRNIGTGNYTEDVDNCGCYFTPVSTPNRQRNDLRLHNFMAICGSAFACDVGALLPKGVSNAIRDNINLKSSPILGSGLTEIIYGNAPTAPSCMCRDAGIDFNVPFPPLLPEANRQFDIIIAMDAGADSTNAYELERAVELGYLKLHYDGTKPLEAFPTGNRVRVYRCVNGGPTIIYFLGLTKRPTGKIIYKADQVVRDTAAVRQSVMDELIPIYLSELRICMANKFASDGLLRQTSSSDYSPLSQPRSAVRFSASNRVVAGARVGGGDDDEHDPTTLAGTSSSMAYTPSTPFSPSSLVGSFASANPFNALAESIIASAAAHSQLKSSVDPFFVVERAVLASLPQADRRVGMLSVLEEEAIALISGIRLVKPLKERLLAIGADLVELLAQIGVLRRLDWNDVVNRNVEMVETWVDFYATTSLIRHLLPSCNLGSDGTNRALKVIQREGVRDVNSTEHIELIFINSTRFKTNSRMCMMLGSIVSKISRNGFDLGATASSVIARRYILQITRLGAAVENAALVGRTEEDGIISAIFSPVSSAPAAANVQPTPNATAVPMPSNLTPRQAAALAAAKDQLEVAVMRMCDHVVEFFAEMLSFDHLNTELALSPWDTSVLGTFVKTVHEILKKPPHTDKLSASAHGLLLAEAIARHPSDRSVVLLRVLCEDKTRVPAFASLPHLGTPADLDPSGTRGIVLCAAQDPKTHCRHDEDLLRIMAAAFDAPDGGNNNNKLRRDAIEAILTSMKSSSALRITSADVAYKNCFASAIRFFLKNGKFDDKDAVTVMLNAQTHYATMNKSQNKRHAIFVMWSEGIETQLFREHLAAQCLAALQLYDFMSAYITTITIPPATAEWVVEDVLSYAERHSKSVKKVIAGADEVAKWSAENKSRYERVNNPLLNTAHEVKSAVADKVTGVAGALALGVRGFLGKKK